MSTRIHAFTDDVLADHDATALAQLIQRKELSSAEVVEAAIRRAEQVNGDLNAIKFAAFDTAREHAKETHTGIFAGVPTFIKDNTDVKGLPTQNGTKAYKAVPAKNHGVVTKEFLKQGVVVLGKTTLPEFGFSASTEFDGLPPTRNPWHTEYSCGASSGGAAALVASGVVPFAHANDGGGSIRIPAAACGLVGLKPSRGRLVKPEAAYTMMVNILADGIVSRSVRDTANFFYGIEKGFKSALKPIGLVEGAAKQRLRIGLALDSITGTPTDFESRQAVLNTAKLLAAQGHIVEEIPLTIPAQFIDDFSAYWGLLSHMISNLGKVAFAKDFDAAKTDNLSKGLAALYKKQMLKTPFIIYRLRKIQSQYQQLFAQHDILLSPVLGHTTPKLGHLSPEQSFDSLYELLLNYVSFTPINNVAGGPGMSLPLGETSEGLPIGVQLSAGIGEERKLLELAFELEALQPFRKIQYA